MEYLKLYEDSNESFDQLVAIFTDYVQNRAGEEQNYKDWVFSISIMDIFLFDKNNVKFYCSPYWSGENEICLEFKTISWQIPVDSPPKNDIEREKFFNLYFQIVHENLEIVDKFVKLEKLIKLILKTEKIGKLDLNITINDVLIKGITKSEIFGLEKMLSFDSSNWTDVEDLKIFSSLYDYLSKEYGELENFFPIKESTYTDTKYSKIYEGSSNVRDSNIKKLVDYFKIHSDKEYFYDDKTWKFYFDDSDVFIFKDKNNFRIYATPFFLHEDTIPVEKSGGEDIIFKEPVKLPETDEERKKFFDWYFNSFMPKVVYMIFYPEFFTKESIKLDIKCGDTLLGGKFKNKQVIVKDIDKDENGQVTINGKPLLKFRIWKNLPKRMKDKYKLKNKNNI